MKNNIKYSVCILTAMMFPACNAFLEEKVISGVSYDFLETRTGIETAVNGAYTAMRWYVGGERYYCLTEYGVDYVWEGADGGQKDAFNKYSVQMNPEAGLLYEFWENNYKGINRINTALMYLPKVADMSGEEKTLREGELRFMRAYFYFDLVQHFGPIPLITEGNVTEIITGFRRAPVPEVYDAIIADLKIACDALPDATRQTQRGRATRWAASHLLAKVYLTRGSAVKDQRGQQASDMPNALSHARAVIESGKFALENDYAATFDQQLQKTSSETIFAVEFTTDIQFNGDGNRMHLYWVPTYENLPGLQRDIRQGRAWKRVRPTPYFQTQLFDHLNDSRFYKMFKWVYWANKESSIPLWQEKYYYVDQDGRVTGDLLYEPPAELVGKPRFGVGDTAAYFIPKSYGAKDHTNKVLDEENNRRLQLDVAKSPYTLIPVDNNTNHFFPGLLKWLDPERPDMNYEQGSRNFTRMRLAETYLIAAEAAGRMGNLEEAAGYINAVRQRAAYREDEPKPKEWTTVDGGDPALLTASTGQAMMVTAADLAADFTGFMLDERCREMFGEMNRWEDLVRTETLLERVTRFNPDAANNIREYHKLRPIPQKHIDRLAPPPPLAEAQNEGYY